MSNTCVNFAELWFPDKKALPLGLPTFSSTEGHDREVAVKGTLQNQRVAVGLTIAVCS